MMRTPLDRIKQCMETGRAVAVNAQSGRGRWWVQIVEVKDDRFIRVKSTGKMFGAPRWVGVDDIMFK